MARPEALILTATGSNRDRDVALALGLAGATPTILPMHDALATPGRLAEAQLLVLPGGFSYGDDLGAGRLWALELRSGLQAAITEFVVSGKPVLGICNGFQALVKSGLLPGPEAGAAEAFAPQHASLGRNARAHFECRWVWLEPDPSCRSPWLGGLRGQRVFCPVAHGEGRFVADPDVLAALDAGGQLALRYVDRDGGALPEGDAAYPQNPNGSALHVAGICNAAGNVLGLMPHPEDHVVPSQRPRHSSGPSGLGLPLFAAGVAYAAGR
ncbi:MAG: phosphoribosylformylglycinamidine synthase I [Deltaproteobacteria bacterium]|nr:phosphoribosylformylglycinamidine synthase I [Deltaproteobacteria bacterium]